jgi:CDP-diacylglycerol--glycerol-3-phosphate 3-phosphatidyltransferase
VKAYYFSETKVYTVPVLNIIAEVLCLGAVIMTVVSLIDYILKNKDVMKDQK